jgi:hypothetical protein
MHNFFFFLLDSRIVGSMYIAHSILIHMTSFFVVQLGTNTSFYISHIAFLCKEDDVIVWC